MSLLTGLHNTDIPLSSSTVLEGIGLMSASKQAVSLKTYVAYLRGGSILGIKSPKPIVESEINE